MSSISSPVFSASDLHTVLRFNPWLECIGGHSVRPFSDLQLVVPQVKYVTILRNPARRYVSQYIYWNAVLKKNMSFSEFLDNDETFDCQVRKISGTRDCASALEILRARFVAVGIVEQFAKFLHHLAQRLSPRAFDVSFEKINTASDELISDELISKHRGRIEERNSNDIQLYEAVQKDWMNIGGNCQSSGYNVPGSGLNQRVNYRDRAKSIADYVLRKSYYEPATGALRMLNGLPYSGSY